VRWWSRSRAAVPEPVLAAPSDPGWRAHPAVQRTVAPIPSVAGVETFSAELTTWRDPRFVAPLAHGLDASAPAGVVHGLVEPAPALPPNAMPVVAPPVRRSTAPDRAPLTTWLLPTQRSAATGPDLLAAGAPNLPVLHVPALPGPAVADVTAAPVAAAGSVPVIAALPSTPNAVQRDRALPSSPTDVRRDIAPPSDGALWGVDAAQVTVPAATAAPAAPAASLPLLQGAAPGDDTTPPGDAPVPLPDVVQRSLDADPKPVRLPAAPAVDAARGVRPVGEPGSRTAASDDATVAGGPGEVPLLGVAPAAAEPEPGSPAALQRSASGPAPTPAASHPVASRGSAAGEPGSVGPTAGPADPPAADLVPGPVADDRVTKYPVGPVVARAADAAPGPSAATTPTAASARSAAGPEVEVVAGHLTGSGGPPPPAGDIDPLRPSGPPERGLLGDGASYVPAAVSQTPGPHTATVPDLPTVSRSVLDHSVVGLDQGPSAATSAPVDVAPPASAGASRGRVVPADADVPATVTDLLAAGQIQAEAPLLSDVSTGVAPPDPATADADLATAVDPVLPLATGPTAGPASWDDGPARLSIDPAGLLTTNPAAAPALQRSTVGASPAAFHPVQRSTVGATPATVQVQRSASAPSANWPVPPGAAATASTGPLPVAAQRAAEPPAPAPAGARIPEPYAGPDPAGAALAAGVAQRDASGSVVFTPATGPLAVQRQPEPVATDPEVQRAAATGPPAAAPPDLEELARRLFDPLCAHLKAELRLDRERAGLVTDLRR